MLKLYIISQDVNDDYDTYDAAVVAAESEDEARLVHPNEYKGWEDTSSWARKPEQVKVKEIGVANSSVQKGEIIVASYRAG